MCNGMVWYGMYVRGRSLCARPEALKTELRVREQLRAEGLLPPLRPDGDLGKDLPKYRYMVETGLHKHQAPLGPSYAEGSLMW